MESKLKPYILLAPVAIILISIMGFGIANCVMQSLGYMPYIGAENISFRFYKEVIRDSVFLESLIFSLKTSFISSTVAVFIGVILAYFLSQEKLSKIKRITIKLTCYNSTYSCSNVDDNYIFSIRNNFKNIIFIKYYK